MKKISLMIVLSILNLPNAFAFDGTITITGRILEQTCKISTETKDLSVALPTLPKSNFDGKTTAGRTMFSIIVSDCSGTKVAVYFEPVGVGAGPSNLKNQATSGAANNVEVRLLGSSGLPITFATREINNGPQTNSQWVNVVNNSATMSYYAEYISTAGSITAGNVVATVQYTILYQ